MNDSDSVKEDRERLKTSPIRYDSANGHFFWEGIPDCNKKRCPIFTTCQYPKIGSCGLRKRYLSVIERLIFGCLEKKSPRSKLKIGFHLIPLYNQLFTAKLKCIANDSLENSREVRTILRSIEMIFKTLGKKKVSIEDIPSTPESEYYDQMSAAGMTEAGEPAVIKPISKRKQKRGRKPKVKVEALNKEFGVI